MVLLTVSAAIMTFGVLYDSQTTLIDSGRTSRSLFLHPQSLER